MFRTNSDFQTSQFKGEPWTLPAGSRVTLVKNASGIDGDLFAAADITQLKALTGNTHDPVYRYLFLPADLIEGDTAADKEAIAGAVQRLNTKRGKG